MSKLTIGMITYDDFDGVYFTLQSLRLHHPEAMNDVEFIIIDNNPDSNHGKEVKNLTGWGTGKVRYVGFTEYNSTAVRTKIFEMATTPYVLCLDCHVLLSLGAVKRLIDFFEAGKDQGNLLQGPMMYDDLKGVATHFDLVWRAQMWGIWGSDERGANPDNEPFEIPAQGLGLFACRKDSWLGFNPNFRGFGGEEGYIHEKYRLMGKKTLCLPFLRWVHRFGRPNGVRYPLTIENKIRNYFIGHLELGKDVTPVIEHFKEFTTMENLNKLYNEAKNAMQNS